MRCHTLVFGKMGCTTAVRAYALQVTIASGMLKSLKGAACIGHATPKLSITRPLNHRNRSQTRLGYTLIMLSRSCPQDHFARHLFDLPPAEICCYIDSEACAFRCFITHTFRHGRIGQIRPFVLLWLAGGFSDPFCHTAKGVRFRLIFRVRPVRAPGPAAF